MKKTNKNKVNETENSIETVSENITETINQYHLNAVDAHFIFEKFLNTSYVNKHELDIIASLKKAFKVNPNIQVLDIGCGPGRIIKAIKKTMPNFDLKNYFVIDKSKSMLERISTNFPDVSIVDDLKDIEDKEFDFIFSFDVFQHQKDYKQFLDSLLSLQTKNLYISCWVSQYGNGIYEITLPSGNSYPERVYSYDEINDIAAKFNLSLNIFDIDNPFTIMKHAILAKSV